MIVTNYRVAEKLNKKIIERTAFSRAYSAWFSDYERERKRQKKRGGASLADFPDAPANPERIAELIDAIGQRKTIQALGVHRSTVARWLAGRIVIPRPCYLLLELMAEGRLPGMSDDWRDFRFDGDRLHLVGTRTSYTAREISGWHYQVAHADALARRIAELERQNAHLLRVGDFGAANDALMSAV